MLQYAVTENSVQWQLVKTSKPQGQCTHRHTNDCDLVILLMQWLHVK